MQRVLYILSYSLLWLLSILPMWILYILSGGLYLVAYHLIGYRKKTVRENLSLVLSEKTEAERKTIEKQFYKHLCDLIVETVKTISISEAELRKRYVISNPELLDRYFKEGRSTLVFCGHYANWEWSSIISSVMPHEGYGVYKSLDNPAFNTLVKKIRGKFGATIITNKQVVKVLFRKAKEGARTTTLIVADQTPRPGNFKHKDTFMGIKVPVFTGTEELSKRLDFVALYLKTEKIKRGHYKATFIPLAEDPSSYQNYELTRMFLSEIEKQIAEAPQYYLWSHKRWKHRDR
ncbi:lysophospholipid acyltransferase family protein [Altibacter lentus]|uniref:lysophospholipid acyltransferase family protein n=1 Tax=Altibacter lentus TaxID=1223410 RepID=UPI000552958B|nr:lysophospholipid acyltransferase family protein [Altibacter lentus]